MSDLTTFIPAGGIGSRLHPHTLETPKPLLLMGSSDRRIIDWPIEASTAASSHVWVGADYLAAQLEDYLSETPDVTVLNDPTTLGSAGSLLTHYPTISDVELQGSMLILPSDHVYENFSAADLWNHHLESEADITLLTVTPKTYGEFVTVNGNRAVAVNKVQTLGGLSTTGIFIITNKYLMEWTWKNLRVDWENKNYNIYHDIIVPAIGNAAVAHFFMDASSGYWEDAGQPERYLRSNMRFSGGKNVLSPQATVDPAASLEGCVVLGQTTIDASVALKNAIISTRGGSLAVTQIVQGINGSDASLHGEPAVSEMSSSTQG